MSQYANEQNAPRKVRKLFAILSTVAILSIVYSKNFGPSIVKPHPSSQNTTTENTNKDQWVKFAEEVYGYSAYCDRRISKSRAFLRVIAIANRRPSTITNLKCRVKVGNTEDEGIILFDFIEEDHDMKHAAVIINCVPRKLRAVPEAISIYSTLENTKKQWISVKRADPSRRSSKGKVAVCVRPLFGPFGKIYQLIGFLSFYIAIGSSHFLFYNQNITNDVKDYLEMLSNKISLDTLPWNIPSAVGDAWANGQLASVQDCIYRYMYMYEYVLIVDLDEYVVPKQHYRLQDTINSFVASDSRKQFGAFVIRNVFFCTNESTKDPFFFLNNTERLNNIMPAMLRSKVLVKPEAVMVSKIHSVQKMSGKWQQVVLPVESAVLHHYREGVCEANSVFSRSNSSYLVEDRTALKYSRDVLNSPPLQLWKDFFL